MEMFGSSHICAGHSNILDKIQILTPPYYLSNILPHPFPCGKQSLNPWRLFFVHINSWISV